MLKINPKYYIQLSFSDLNNIGWDKIIHESFDDVFYFKHKNIIDKYTNEYYLTRFVIYNIISKEEKDSFKGLVKNKKLFLFLQEEELQAKQISGVSNEVARKNVAWTASSAGAGAASVAAKRATWVAAHVNVNIIATVGSWAARTVIWENIYYHLYYTYLYISPENVNKFGRDSRDKLRKLIGINS